MRNGPEQHSTTHGAPRAAASDDDIRLLSPEQARALLGVVSDMAEDFAFCCSVTVLDAEGHPFLAARPAAAPAGDLDDALDAGRAALRLHGRGLGVSAGTVLVDRGVVIGAVGVSGGPPGFAAEAAAAAARALDLT